MSNAPDPAENLPQKPRRTKAQRIWEVEKRCLKNTLGEAAIMYFDAQVALFSWTQLRTIGEQFAVPPHPECPFLAIAPLTSMIAAYGRIFGGGALGLKAEPPWVLPHEDPLHKYLMRLRHGMVAHSDWKQRRIRLLPRGNLTIPGKEQLVAGRLLMWHPPCDDEAVEARFRRLLEATDTATKNAIDALEAHCPACRVTTETLLDQI